jgi:hypothetical protein
MSRKTLIMVGMTLGSIVGGYVPVLFGASGISFTSLFCSGAGAILGIYLAYKMTRNI